MKENEIPLDQLASGRKRVLVVDDDQAIVDMFTELLERDGRFEVRTAQNRLRCGNCHTAVSPGRDASGLQAPGHQRKRRLPNCSLSERV